MPNYKIVIEYDGTLFVGWQQQLNGNSIQGAIQLALIKLLGEEIPIFGAGRTDAGVHAYAQVASFNLKKKIEYVFNRTHRYYQVEDAMKVN